ncbi:MAG: hypothetical protein AAGF26_02710 [Cyanobacteria bacterium P01_G01_bin.49]
MSLLSNTDLPEGFTTIEQLMVYLSVIATTIHPNDSYLVTSTVTEKIADAGIIRTEDGRDFYVGRFAVPLNPEYTTPDSPLWTYAQEVKNVDIPSRFKAAA